MDSNHFSWGRGVPDEPKKHCELGRPVGAWRPFVMGGSHFGFQTS